MNIDRSWLPFFERDDNIELLSRINSNFNIQNWSKEIYPHKDEVFNAFSIPFDDIKAVILGQDPYHGPGQAHGLSFSVQGEESVIPPSLKNILEEVRRNYPNAHFKKNKGDLTCWHDQGVMLLNSILTVSPGQPLSHQRFGWHKFTNEAIKYIATNKNNVVFMLWGSYARSKKDIILSSGDNHLVLESGHPSPLSVKHFRENSHFKYCNHFLIGHGLEPIDWSIR